jgi:Domain of unknown function (DUF1905)/Bacteriocin-protection, YdeI or OmpD-Associated
MERFDATIEAADRGGAYVTVPDPVVEALGGGGRIPVEATFDGVPYRGSIVSMGGARCVGLLKSIREQLGKGPGDAVAVTVARDEAERTVTVAPDLAAALDEAGARPAFDELSFSHRREYANWIDEAKRPETRQRRIAQTVERITQR